MSFELINFGVLKSIQKTLTFYFIFFQGKINGILKERWINLSDKEKNVWKQWQIWDNLRYKRDCIIYDAKHSQKVSHKSDNRKAQTGASDSPKKVEEPKSKDGAQRSTFHIPKKKRLMS